MNNTSEKEMSLFSEKLNHLRREKQLEEAKKLLLEEVAKYPDEYYLWTSLAQTCSGLAEHNLALEYSKKAMSLCDDDVLTIYNHALALVNTESYNESLHFCQQILRKTIGDIAQNGEGVRWAKSIRNDTMYLQAVCLCNTSKFREALHVLQKLLTLRERGVYSDFSKKQVGDKIKTVEQHLINT